MVAEMHCRGHIDKFEGGRVEGWIHLPSSAWTPLITIDNFPVTTGVSWIPRDDVKAALNIDDVKGFCFTVPFNVSKNSIIKLYGVSLERAELLHEVASTVLNNVPSSISKLQEICNISQQKHAVVIISEEGDDGEIARACQLYNIIAPMRPVCIITIQTNHKKHPIWLPLLNTNLPVFSIAKEDIGLLECVVRNNSVGFKTIWLCQPTYAALSLKDMLSNGRTRCIADIHRAVSSSDDLHKYFKRGDLTSKPALRELVNEMLPVRSISSLHLKQEYGGSLINSGNATGLDYENCDPQSPGSSPKVTASKETRTSSSYNLTSEDVFEKFKRLEKKAKRYTSNAPLDIIRDWNKRLHHKTNQRKKFVLVWKQNDASIYGRRVDIIARMLKKSSPDAEIHVLELCTPGAIKHHTIYSANEASDSSLILQRIKLKKHGYHFSGVTYDNIYISSGKKINTEVNRFLINNDLLPSTTSFILFPLIPEYRNVIAAIQGYPFIVDVVDNQTSWINEESGLVQAAFEYTSLFKTAKAIVFNSQINLTVFSESGLLDEQLVSKALHIPNWYELPLEEVQPAGRKPTNKLEVIYSGNMNDRIKWSLLQRLVSKYAESLNLTVIGNALHAQNQIRELLQYPNVNYLGPLDELNCLAQLKVSDVAIMPHLTDDTSKYMNPLKVKMYNTVGLKCISTDVPGLDGEENLLIARSDNEFVSLVGEFIQEKSQRSPREVENKSSRSEYAQLYRSIVEKTLVSEN